MVNKTIIVILLLLCFPFVSSAASISTSENCSSVKDAKKRLICYDSASKQTSNDAKTSVEDKKEISQTQAIVDAPVKADRSISVEAGLVYKSGDVKPVARTEFYLLDESLVEILKKKNIKTPMVTGYENDPNYFETIYPSIILISFAKIASDYESFRNDDEATRKLKVFYEQTKVYMILHTVQKGTTSFSGRLKFESIKPGIYYLMGVYKTARGAAIWNYKVDVKNSETTITLDQNNAAYVD